MENSPLCRLPIELRNVIAEYALYQHDPIEIAQTAGRWTRARPKGQHKDPASRAKYFAKRLLLCIGRGNKRSPAALLFVCRRLYEDYAQLFYNINTFALHCGSYGIRSTIFQFQRSVGRLNAAALRNIIAIRHLGTFALQDRQRRYISSSADDFCIGFCGTLCEAPAPTSFCREFYQERESSFEVEFKLNLVASRKAIAWVRVRLTESEGHLFYEYKEVRVEIRKKERLEVIIRLFMYEIETMVRVWCESYQYCQKCFGLIKMPYGRHECPKLMRRVTLERGEEDWGHSARQENEGAN